MGWKFRLKNKLSPKSVFYTKEKKCPKNANLDIKEQVQNEIEESQKNIFQFFFSNYVGLSSVHFLQGPGLHLNPRTTKGRSWPLPLPMLSVNHGDRVWVTANLRNSGGIFFGNTGTHYPGWGGHSEVLEEILHNCAQKGRQKRFSHSKKKRSPSSHQPPWGWVGYKVIACLEYFVNWTLYNNYMAVSAGRQEINFWSNNFVVMPHFRDHPWLLQ